jgi:nucleotide-binding universal stress UspA family protein
LVDGDGKAVLIGVAQPPVAVRDPVSRKYIPMTEQDEDRQQSAIKEELGQIAARWREAAPHSEFHISSGDPATEILRAAATYKADAIVMASHGLGALGRWRFGSVADRVSRTSKVPVVIVRPNGESDEEGGELSRIVLPYDGSDLAAAAVPFAEALAMRLKLPVTVVQAFDPSTPVTAIAGGLAPVPPDVYNEAISAMEQQAITSVDAVVQRLRDNGVDAESKVLVGPAAAALLTEAGPTDIVVLSSHGRGGVTRWLLGSVAEKLIRLSDAAVALVPSPGRATD